MKAALGRGELPGRTTGLRRSHTGKVSLACTLAKGDYKSPPVNRVNCALVQSMLNALPLTYVDDYDAWRDTAFAVHGFDSGSIGLALFDRFSRRYQAKYDAARVPIEKFWSDISRGDEPGSAKIGLGWLVHEAQRHGWTWPRHWDFETPDVRGNATAA